MQASVHDLIGDAHQVAGHAQSRMNEAAHILVGHHIPDAIAGKDQKLIAILAALAEDLRLRGYQLLALALLLDVLKVIIAQSSRDSQRAVNALDHNTATGIVDALLLLRQNGFVVLRGEDRHALATENSTRIPAIGDVHLGEADKSADGGGPAAFLLLLGELRQVPHHLIDAQEARAYSLHVIAANELLGANDAVQQMFCTMLGHLASGMAVEHSEEAPILERVSEAGARIVGILHLTAPALHRANTEEQLVALALVIVLGGFRLIQESAHVH